MSHSSPTPLGRRIGHLIHHDEAGKRSSWPNLPADTLGKRSILAHRFIDDYQMQLECCWKEIAPKEPSHSPSSRLLGSRRIITFLIHTSSAKRWHGRAAKHTEGYWGLPWLSMRQGLKDPDPCLGPSAMLLCRSAVLGSWLNGVGELEDSGHAHLLSNGREAIGSSRRHKRHKGRHSNHAHYVVHGVCMQDPWPK